MGRWGRRPISPARAACRVATLILALFFPGAAPAVTGLPPAPENSLGMSDTCYLQTMMYDVIIDGVVESLVVKKTDPENGAVWCRSELCVKVLRSVLGEYPTGLVRVMS